MDELIKRNDLLKEICGWCTNYVADTPICEEKECAYTLCVKSAPAVDAEPVIHAHWNYKCPINGKSYRYCSNCLTIFYDYDKYEIKKFCAGCGAKMEGRY